MCNINEFLNDPYVRKNEKNGLFIFHYTDSTTYDKKWDDVTRAARGIIFNKNGELIARPWEKFFNLNEKPETRLDYLATLDKMFYVSKKLDGSLGILYYHDSEYKIATKGSFESEQASYATEWIHKNLELSEVNSSYTYLFEIIYPSNKIVVDYKGKEGLVLLGMVHKATGLEVYPSMLKEYADKLHTECVEYVEFNSLSDVVNLTKELVEEEGFVITFNNVNGKDLKIKIKGEWYLMLHKIISNMTPLAFWDAWEIGGIKKEFLEIIPEEFRELSDKISLAVNSAHLKEYDRIKNIYDSIMDNLTPNDVKYFAIECQQTHKNDLGILMAFYKRQTDRAWDGIHKRVRPTRNQMEY